MWYKAFILIGILVLVIVLPQLLSRWMDKDDEDEEDCHCRNSW